MIERLSAEPIQQKQGLRENYSTSARDKTQLRGYAVTQLHKVYLRSGF